MEHLITATGKELESGFMVNTQYEAFLRVKTDLMTAFSIFSNPAETETITMGDTTLEGYTKLASVSDEGGVILIRLDKPRKET